MDENKYKIAGWLALAQAILFPIAFVIGIVEAIVAGKLLEVKRPFIGPSDFLMIVFTAISVYTFLMFRRLLHETIQLPRTGSADHDLNLVGHRVSSH